MCIIRYTAAGGIVIDGGKMLLLDRPARGEVRLPKGHLEDDETPAVAALRETTEETGYADLEIIADLGSRLVEFDYEGKCYQRTEHYFLMQLQSERKIPRAVEDAAQFHVCWIPLAQSAQQLTFKAEQDVAATAVSVYQNL